MRVTSWNIAGARGLSDERVRAVLGVLGRRPRPDIVTLQEVHQDAAPGVIAGLATIGLEHAAFGRGKSAHASHGVLIASCFPMRRTDGGWRKRAPYPDLFASARAETPTGDVEVVTAHIPNGAGNGWKKIEAFECLSRMLWRAVDRPRVLMGDFNEPREVRPNGQVVTFGQRVLGSGGVHADGVYETHGVTDTLRRWDAGVRSVLAGESSHGLRHAYLAKHGFAETPVTYRTQKNPRFFDHILVSRHFRVADAGYDHGVRENDTSDHSLAWAKLTPAG